MGKVVLDCGRRRHDLGTTAHARREYASNVRSGPHGFVVCGDLDRKGRLDARRRGLCSTLEIKTGPDPGVSARQAFAKARLRFPLCDRSKKCVVAVAAANSLWLIRIVDLCETLAGGLTNQIHEPVNGD